MERRLTQAFLRQFEWLLKATLPSGAHRYTTVSTVAENHSDIGSADQSLSLNFPKSFGRELLEDHGPVNNHGTNEVPHNLTSSGAHSCINRGARKLIVDS